MLNKWNLIILTAPSWTFFFLCKIRFESRFLFYIFWLEASYYTKIGKIQDGRQSWYVVGVNFEKFKFNFQRFYHVENLILRKLFHYGFSLKLIFNKISPCEKLGMALSCCQTMNISKTANFRHTVFGINFNAVEPRNCFSSIINV